MSWNPWKLRKALKEALKVLETSNKTSTDLLRRALAAEAGFKAVRDLANKHQGDRVWMLVLGQMEEAVRRERISLRRDT